MAASSPTASLNAPQSLRPLLIGAGLILVAFLALLAIDSNMALFPLFSAIAFPALAAAPFFVLTRNMPTRWKVGLIAIVLLIVVPIIGLKNSSYLFLATQVGIYGAMALGLNIVVGFAGLLDLGYIAFFAVGAYLWGVFTADENTVFKLGHALAAPEAFFGFIILAIIVAAVCGILLGLPVLRLRGDYLAIVTLGFGEMIRILVNNLGNISSDSKVPINITNGAQGLSNIASPPLPQSFIDLIGKLGNGLGYKVENPQSLAYQFFFYFLVLAITLLVVVIVSRLDNSPIGRAWTAIREDETAAIAMGVPLVRMKLLAFAMGASFAGAMGVIYAAKQVSIAPGDFSFDQSIFILAIVIVGGMGSIRGVLLGSVVVSLLKLQVLSNLSLLINNFKTSTEVAPFLQNLARNWPNQLDPAGYQRFVFGILLVIMMIARPAGILPASRRRLELQALKNVPQPSDEEEVPTDASIPITGHIGDGDGDK